MGREGFGFGSGERLAVNVGLVGLRRDSLPWD